MTGNCGTCKWWGWKERDDEGNAQTVYFYDWWDLDTEEDKARYRRAVEIGAKYGLCERIASMPEKDELLDEDIPAFTMDGSRYHSELTTRADFGCVLYEEKKQ